MGMIELKVELLSQLSINRLDDLAYSIEGPLECLRELLKLVATRQGEQLEMIVEQQLLGYFSTDIAFVAKDRQVGMFDQHFSSNGQVSHTGRSQLEIQDQPAQTDQQMQLEAEDGDFLAGNLAKIGSVCSPIACRTGYQVKLNHRHGHRINNGLSIRAQVQHSQHRLADDIKGIHQGPTPTIEPTLGGNVREQVPVFLPLTQHRRFLVPFSAFPHQRPGQQFTVRALARWPSTLKKWLYFLPHIIHKPPHPPAKNVERL